ncbi:MAG: lysozyme [Paraburkholderia tropica]|nr:lysozyme [Paraburkholderia tropica]
MALSDLFAMIARLFGARAAQAPVAEAQPPSVSPSSASSAVPAPVPVTTPSAAPASTGTPAVKPEPPGVPASEPTWLDLCRPLTQFSENCYLTAYPDPASPLAKALQARGIWQKVLGGMPIPADEVLRNLSGAPWTCGWGQTGPDVKQGTVWTQAQADTRLEQTLAHCGDDIDFAVKVSLAAREKAALADLRYNIGVGAFGSSTLLKLLNAGDRAGAAAQFAVWNKAGGVVLAGLVARRARERDLFLTGAWSKS